MNIDATPQGTGNVGVLAAALFTEAATWERRIMPTFPPLILPARTSCIWEALDRDLAKRALEGGRSIRDVARTLAARSLARSHGRTAVREAAWKAWAGARA